jgi:hypothetical protein
VQCLGSHISFTDLVKSNQRCPNINISSDLEHFLLLVGHFDVPSINLHHLDICASHYHHLIATRRCNKCELCKPLFGKSKSCFKRELLRPVNKVQAVSVWYNRGLCVYNQWVCDACRKVIDKDFVTNETKEKAHTMFQRLYNEQDDIVRTPSTAIKSCVDDDDEYCESFDVYSPTLQRNPVADFQQMLRDQGFNGRVRTSLSYSTTSLKYQRDYRTQVKKIFLHLAQLLVPDEYEQLWQGIVDDENKNNNNNSPDNKYVRSLCYLNSM